MPEEQSAGVTVLFGSAITAVNFPKAQYIGVDAQGVLTVYADRDHIVAVFPSGGWHRAFNLTVDQPKKVVNPIRQ